jgi:hypothetical protein
MPPFPFVFLLTVFVLACCALFTDHSVRIGFKVLGIAFSFEAEGRNDTSARLKPHKASGDRRLERRRHTAGTRPSRSTRGRGPFARL